MRETNNLVTRLDLNEFWKYHFSSYVAGAEPSICWLPSQPGFMLTGQLIDMHSKDAQNRLMNGGMSTHHLVQPVSYMLGRALACKELLMGWRGSVGPQCWMVLDEKTGDVVMSLCDWISGSPRPDLVSQYVEDQADPRRRAREQALADRLAEEAEQHRRVHEERRSKRDAEELAVWGQPCSRGEEASGG